MKNRLIIVDVVIIAIACFILAHVLLHAQQQPVANVSPAATTLSATDNITVISAAGNTFYITWASLKAAFSSVSTNLPVLIAGGGTNTLVITNGVIKTIQ